MAAADLLGSMCWVIPKRIGVFLIALFFALVGVWHLGVMGIDIIYAFFGQSNALKAQACQGSQCHEEWRDEVFTCHGFKNTTFHIRYLTMGVLGPVFGIFGMRGVLDRHYLEMRSFCLFMVFVWGLYLGCFLTDLLYIGACGIYPTTILRDINPILNEKRMAMVRALGYVSLDGLSLEKVEMCLGFDVMPVYAILLFFGLCFFAYCIYNAFDLNSKMEGGPVGLGPLYLIATPADREIATISAAIKQAQAEEDTKYDFHSALERLKDAERYPFVTFRDPVEPIGYGAVGAPQAMI